MMRMRFAIWETGPACYFDHRHLPELEEHGVGVGGGLKLATFIYENHVELRPCEDGAPVMSSSGTDVWPFRLDDRHAEYVARCHVMDLDFEWWGDHWHADLPLPHLLPWPVYHEFENGSYSKREAALREIKVRTDSAERHTGSRRINVDESVQALLTSGERVRLFQEWRI